MKDKLIKTHHKAVYYRARRFCFSVMFLFTCSMSISLPAYITLHNNEMLTLKAEENKEINSSENSSSYHDCDLSKNPSSL